jgi:purine nucleoside phosphorylase
LPDFEVSDARETDTPWGPVLITHGRFAGAEVLHVSRHGEGHARLSNHVNHRANIWGLKAAGAQAVIGCTACGAMDPAMPLGTVIVFDDLHFIVNRLPNGEICTLFDTPGDPQRGHWIIGPPFCGDLREALVEGAREANVPVSDGGVYGHVDGPRFNTPVEIRQLAAAGVTAVSQTGGPETTLCGEAELPYALMGYATDYANEIRDEATPVDELIRLMGESTHAFAAILEVALPVLDLTCLRAPGTVYRFEGPAEV